jgi:3-(3-hydroxy-phenyl)propionate hydroxylase
MPKPYAETPPANSYQFAQGSGYVLPEYDAVIPAAVQSGEVEEHGIVIVGGGLTGLTLACALGEYGVQAVLLDEDNTVGVKGASSRGICYTQKSLEIFDRLGIYHRIAAKGVQWNVGRTFAGNDEVYRFDLKQTPGFKRSQQPPFINIQQFYIEGFLVEQIQALPSVQLRWNNRVTGLEQGDGLATLSIATPAGEYRAKARFIIDCTGAKTPFRDWLGVQVNTTKGDDRWCIADVRFKEHPPAERHTWIEAPFNEGRAVWQHLMADDVWRLDYQMAPDSDPEAVSRESVVRARINRQFGKDVDCEIVWVGPYAYRSECVQRMGQPVGQSTVFFAGDTAKVVSPFGARGGNSGIADADNLAWKLASVVQGFAAPQLLDSYHDERHEAAQTNVLVTNRTARFLRPADGMERLFRSAVISLAKQYPFAQGLVNTGRMAVANTYTASRACASGGGVSVPNIALQWPDGEAGQLNDLLYWANGALVLLCFGPITQAVAQRLRALHEGAGVVAVQVARVLRGVQAREAVIDPSGSLQTACAAPQNGWALLRPDSYVAAAGPHVDGQLVQAVEKSLGARA